MSNTDHGTAGGAGGATAGQNQGGPPPPPPGQAQGQGGQQGQGPPPAGSQGGAPGGEQRPRPRVDDLSDEVLEARLQRERRKGREETLAGLLGKFGAKDEAELEARVRAADALSSENEKKKRSEMSELEQVRADLAATRAENERLKTEKQSAEEARTAVEQEQVFRRACAKHVDPSMADAALMLLARHVRQKVEESPDEEFSERDAERFFRALVAKNAKFSPSAPPARKPVSTGAAPPSPPPGSPPAGAAPAGGGTLNGKTVLPGRPNSMSPAELAQYAKSRGLSSLSGGRGR